MASVDKLEAGKVNDQIRIDYLSRHLAAVAHAMEQGVDIRSYFYWSLMDNFEWNSGYAKRFGLIYVDYASQQRTMKESAYWYRDFIQAQKILSLGNFKLGIGGVVTFKNSGLDKVVEQLKLHDIVLETDAPYLTPVPFRGKRNESSYLQYVVQKIAAVKNISVEEVAEVTNKNAEDIYGIE